MRVAPLARVLLLVLGAAATARAEDADRDVAHTLVVRSLEQHLSSLVEGDAAFDTSRTYDDLSPTMRADFDGLAGFLSAVLQTQFLGFSTDGLRLEWQRRYWKLRDPTPTTPENERLDEHARRLLYVRERHAIAAPPHFDDAGLFYLKFGPPDAIHEELGETRQGVGYVPTRQWWVYMQLGFEAVFSQTVPQGPWIRGDRRVKATTRPELAHEATAAAGSFREDADRPRYDEIAPTPSRPDFIGGLTGAAAIAGDEYAQAPVDHFVLAQDPGKPLSCVFDVDAFRGTTGRTRVEVHLQTALRDFRFAWSDSLYAARYRVEAVLLDDAVNEAAYDSYDDLVRASAFRTTLSDILWPGQLQFEVAPGRYRLAVWIRDTRSGDSSRIVADLLVPRLDGEGLAVSDLELASWIGPDAGTWSPRFNKRDRIVVPNPAGTYTPPSLFLGYFEIYGLQLDAQGLSRYQVAYSIRPREGRPASGWFPKPGREESPSVTAQFIGAGKASDLHELLRIDLSALESGAHEMEITVRDLVAGTETTTQTRFALLR